MVAETSIWVFVTVGLITVSVFWKEKFAVSVVKPVRPKTTLPERDLTLVVSVVRKSSVTEPVGVVRTRGTPMLSVRFVPVLLIFTARKPVRVTLVTPTSSTPPVAESA